MVPEPLAQTGGRTGPSPGSARDADPQTTPKPGEVRARCQRQSRTEDGHTHTRVTAGGPGLRSPEVEAVWVLSAPAYGAHTHTCAQPPPHTPALWPVAGGVGAQVSTESGPQQVRGCLLDPNGQPEGRAQASG